MLVALARRLQVKHRLSLLSDISMSVGKLDKAGVLEIQVLRARALIARDFEDTVEPISEGAVTAV